MNEQNRTVQNLVIRLGHLAAEWRGGSDSRNFTVQKYHDIVAQLYELGWDDVIGIESELPEELMPEEYLDRNPPFYSSRPNMTGTPGETDQ